MLVSAGYYVLTSDESVAVIESKCKDIATSPPPQGVVVNTDGQEYTLRSPEWKEGHGVLLATMCRIRERGLPWQVDDEGTHRPINARLSEPASFAYRPSRGLILIQWNNHGPRHNRAARLLESAGIFKACHITPEITADAMARMDAAPLVRRLEFSLAGVDTAREPEVRDIGVNGILDDLRRYDGTAIHVSISLGHMPGQLNDTGVRALVKKLIGLPERARTVKVGVKESEDHVVEMLDLISCRSKLEFEVTEIGREIDHGKCREHLLVAIDKR